MKIGDYLIHGVGRTINPMIPADKKTLDDFSDAIFVELNLEDNSFFIPINCMQVFLYVLSRNINIYENRNREINLINYIPARLNTSYILTDSNNETYADTTSLMKHMEDGVSKTNYFKRVRLIDKDESDFIYYVRKNVILDSNKNELFSVGVRISKNIRTEQSKRNLYGDLEYTLIKNSFLGFENWVIRLNSSIFRKSDPVSKYLRTKFLSYITSEDNDFSSCRIHISKSMFFGKYVFDSRNKNNSPFSDSKSFILPNNPYVEILITERNEKEDIVCEQSKPIESIYDSFFTDSVVEDLIGTMTYHPL